MLDPITADLLLTLAASAALLSLWVISALVLPWTDQELDEALTSVRGLGLPRLAVFAGAPQRPRA